MQGEGICLQQHAMVCFCVGRRCRFGGKGVLSGGRMVLGVQVQQVEAGGSVGFHSMPALFRAAAVNA